MLSCAALCTHALGWHALGWAGPFTSAGLLGQNAARKQGLSPGYYSTAARLCRRGRRAKLELRAGVTNKYCPRRQAAGRERGLATPRLSRMPAKGGRSSDKADSLAWQTRKPGKLEGAGHVRRKRWRRLQRQGAFITFGSGPLCATVNRRTTFLTQAGKAGRQPSHLRKHDYGYIAGRRGEGLRRPRSCLADPAWLSLMQVCSFTCQPRDASSGCSCFRNIS